MNIADDKSAWQVFFKLQRQYIVHLLQLGKVSQLMKLTKEYEGKGLQAAEHSKESLGNDCKQREELREEI